MSIEFMAPRAARRRPTCSSRIAARLGLVAEDDGVLSGNPISQGSVDSTIAAHTLIPGGGGQKTAKCEIRCDGKLFFHIGYDLSFSMGSSAWAKRLLPKLDATFTNTRNRSRTTKLVIDGEVWLWSAVARPAVRALFHLFAQFGELGFLVSSQQIVDRIFCASLNDV